MSGVDGESVSSRETLAPDRGVIFELSEAILVSSFLGGDNVCCRRLRCGCDAGDAGPAPASRGVRPCAGRVRKFELNVGVNGFVVVVRCRISVGMASPACRCLGSDIRSAHRSGLEGVICFCVAAMREDLHYHSRHNGYDPALDVIIYSSCAAGVNAGWWRSSNIQ